MKNIIRIFITIFITLILFASCKKGNTGTTSTITDTTTIKDTIRITDTLPHPITAFAGFYTGKIGNNSDYPSFQMAFLFRSDGTVRVYNNNISTPGNADTSIIPPAEGTYLLSGDTVTTYCRYLSDTTNTFSTFAIVDSSFSYMEGTWGFGMFNNGGGFFWVYKQY
jgi:hypothetical protein